MDTVVTAMVTGMGMGTVTGMATGTIRMMRRLCVGRVGGRGFLGRGRDGTRDTGRGTNDVTRDTGRGTNDGTRDAGQIDLRFTILDLRFVLQAGVTLNYLTVNPFSLFSCICLYLCTSKG